MEYALSLSYGKDSLACLGAIEKLGLLLDRIVHAEVWFNDDIPADFPDVVEFKKYADGIIYKRWGIKVEHYRSDYTFTSGFWKKRIKGKHIGKIYGFPCLQGHWCNRLLKLSAIDKAEKATAEHTHHYVGIAIDEEERLRNLVAKSNCSSPIADIGWRESDCMRWCVENNLVSPTYSKKNASRDGCWFCPFQNTESLRYLYHEYPELWQELLALDKVNTELAMQYFKPNGRSVHDYNIRFKWEDVGALPKSREFNWSMIDDWR